MVPGVAKKRLSGLSISERKATQNRKLNHSMAVFYSL
jgi:hypothetical protein